MPRFHIRPNGSIGECKAAEGECPFGEDEPHFDTVKEAEEYRDNQKSQNIILPENVSLIKNPQKAKEKLIWFCTQNELAEGSYLGYKEIAELIANDNVFYKALEDNLIFTFGEKSYSKISIEAKNEFINVRVTDYDETLVLTIVFTPEKYYDYVKLNKEIINSTKYDSGNKLHSDLESHMRKKFTELFNEQCLMMMEEYAVYEEYRSAEEHLEYLDSINHHFQYRDRKYYHYNNLRGICVGNNIVVVSTYHDNSYRLLLRSGGRGHSLEILGNTEEASKLLGKLENSEPDLGRNITLLNLKAFIESITRTKTTQS